MPPAPREAVVGDDGIARCPWAVSDPLNLEYHDTEWGLPVRGEAELFERITLEAFQSGLSWLTILRKRPAFRAAFAGFDADAVAAFGDADVERLMADAGIVRNRAKILAACTNARAAVALREHGGLDALVWSHHHPDAPAPCTTADVPAQTPESKALARELKAHGFVFVGPTTSRALMEATGLVDPHLLSCHRRGAGAYHQCTRRDEPAEEPSSAKGCSVSYEVPPLPYGYTALEPTIDEQTMQLHHDKHHQAYVDKANAALEGTDFNGKPVEEVLANLSSLPEDKQGPFRNNGGGHANHTLFWESMSPDGGGAPSGDLGSAIDAAFGSFDAFKEQFEANGVGQFGSGWTWLVLDGGELGLAKTPNQDSPILSGQTPLLGNDVWEHAYYLKYQNKRPAYLKAWWDVVNWDKVAERYAAAKG